MAVACGWLQYHSIDTIVLMTNFLVYSESDADTSVGGFMVRGKACAGLASCLATSIDAIRQGGIGTVLAVAPHDDSTRTLRILFDTSYFIAVTVVLLNMVLGIIIDAFAELRKRTEDMDDKINNMCYICCLDRRTIESGVPGR